MSLVYRALLDPVVWDAVDFDFNISTAEKKVHIPAFPELLIGGAASKWLYICDLRNVIVSDLADENYKLFFGRLAKLNSRRLKEFDEIASEAMAEEIEKE